MPHQEFFDFLIDVYEAHIYATDILAGFRITREPFIGWSMSEVEPGSYFPPPSDFPPSNHNSRRNQ